MWPLVEMYQHLKRMEDTMNPIGEVGVLQNGFLMRPEGVLELE